MRVGLCLLPLPRRVVARLLRHALGYPLIVPPLGSQLVHPFALLITLLHSGLGRSATLSSSLRALPLARRHLGGRLIRLLRVRRFLLLLLIIRLLRVHRFLPLLLIIRLLRVRWFLLLLLIIRLLRVHRYLPLLLIIRLLRVRRLLLLLLIIRLLRVHRFLPLLLIIRLLRVRRFLVHLARTRIPHDQRLLRGCIQLVSPHCLRLCGRLDLRGVCGRSAESQGTTKRRSAPLESLRGGPARF